MNHSQGHRRGQRRKWTAEELLESTRDRARGRLILALRGLGIECAGAAREGLAACPSGLAFCLSAGAGALGALLFRSTLRLPARALRLSGRLIVPLVKVLGAATRVGAWFLPIS
jgi:hypothetical protein